MNPEADLQALCERGQGELMRTDYLRAEATLVEAERIATRLEDYDTLARLYMPLQEARRQRRQTCGEGIVRLDLLARGPDDTPDAKQIVDRYPRGQLLVAGWGTIRPAVELRQLQAERALYVETFLAAVYPTDTGRAVVIVPLADIPVPPMPAAPVTLDALRATVPAYCLVLDERDLPAGERRGTWETYAHVMALWERLHTPYLQAADAGSRPLNKIDGYRRTIEVDYACELAHQRLAAVAHELARERRAST